MWYFEYSDPEIYIFFFLGGGVLTMPGYGLSQHLSKIGLENYKKFLNDQCNVIKHNFHFPYVRFLLLRRVPYVLSLTLPL